ncbi:MAG: B12-binding domain-containing radical SAM protein [Eubacterium sp.]|nr:B12-binding domain-containing radical SAM protein [Eubacterium sp.]
MRILLTAINAKYIHSNLAVYSLKSYAKKHGVSVDLAEYTINHQLDAILEQLYRRKPDVLAFSCYIWNIEYVKELAEEFHRICPEVPIWVGGPEVSFETSAFLRDNPAITGILIGEGEATFLKLCQYYEQAGADNRTEAGDQNCAGESGAAVSLDQIFGIAYRKETGEICHTPMRSLMDLDEIPFCYDEIADFANRIIYYESSRGCPYSCSYCLSSVDKKLRFRSLELVLPELQFFMDQAVPQVKFVDRTFNCKHDHAMAIWQYLAEHDNGITNFHFEISADLLTQEEIDLVKTMRPGLIQFEIGVQTVNGKTIQEIHRSMDLAQLENRVAQVWEGKNIHQHLDLIAGLPYEDFESFKHSFDVVYRMRPQQLQLGFLKVLKGSYMFAHAKEYGLSYRRKPPYEVMATNWISYEEILHLKLVEEVLELHYNSGQFVRSLALLEQVFESPFSLYWQLGLFYQKQGYRGQNYSRMRRSEIFLEFALSVDPTRKELYLQALTFDLYARENVKSRPTWLAGEAEIDKKAQLRFLRSKDKDKKYCHLEYFTADFLQEPGLFAKARMVSTHDRAPSKVGDPGAWVLFDYENRDVMTNEAAVFVLTDSLACEKQKA